jgi:hypothetical protein
VLELPGHRRLGRVVLDRGGRRARAGANVAKQGVQNVGWEVADGVGLLVAGRGGDVFYDDVVVAGKCAGDFC